MDLYKLPKPSLDFDKDVFLKKFNEADDIVDCYLNATRNEYLYWDKIKYKKPPKNMTAEEFWFMIKIMRKQDANRVESAIRDEQGNYFSWTVYPDLNRILHEVDMQLGGTINSPYVEEKYIRERFVSRGIMEEAIASSQLEGANTTRKAAKLMILEKRKPRTRSEKMVLNNYRAMTYIEETLADRDLTIDIIYELHGILTKDTLDPKDISRIRDDKDDILVCDSINGTIYHIPPKRKFIQQEIKRFITYANDKETSTSFVHPVIKAILLHFWIGYLHPFVDGNGRLARTMFYWYLLKNGYWTFAYLPISKVIRKSPGQYRDAYVYSEQDDNDVTYFIDYNLRKIAQAKKEFEQFLKRKKGESQKLDILKQSDYKLNHRQQQLARYLYKNPNAITTIESHSQIYDISRLTARKDLERLEDLQLLKSEKVGRERHFSGTIKLLELLKNIMG